MPGIPLVGGLLIGVALAALLAGAVILIVTSKTAPHTAAQRRNAQISRLNATALCLVGLLLLLPVYLLLGHPAAPISTALLVLGGGLFVTIAVLLLISVGMALNVIYQSERNRHGE